MNSEKPLLEVVNLKKFYPVGKTLFGQPVSHVRAVNGIHLTIMPGETLGLVGESGCGKSTLGRCILKLEEPTSGTIKFDGVDLMTLPAGQLREKRKAMQPVFQDPYSSLNPRRSIGKILEEPFAIHGLHSPAKRREMAFELLELVGMRPEHYHRFPHEFSGGQRQRVAIARAIALKPSLIVADEPVSALDVSIQAQILNLMVDLQEAFNLTLLFISHDLAVVRHLTDRVAVMYQGRIVEIAPTRQLYATPHHPYTRLLLSAIPSTDPDSRLHKNAQAGEMLQGSQVAEGCPFHPRCSAVCERCREKTPKLIHVGDDHYVSCSELDI